MKNIADKSLRQGISPIRLFSSTSQYYVENGGVKRPISPAQVTS